MTLDPLSILLGLLIGGLVVYLLRGREVAVLRHAADVWRQRWRDG